MAFLDTKWQIDRKAPAGTLSETFNFLDGLARSGLTVASYQPSQGMIEAGALAGDISPSRAKEVYLAMISHNE